MRGNVDTRLRKLQETDLDGIILAAAGIKRLLKPEIITQFFDTEQMVPAVGQGALGIEVREGDARVAQLLLPLNDPSATAEITAERTVLERLGRRMSSPDWGACETCRWRTFAHRCGLSSRWHATHCGKEYRNTSDSPTFGRRCCRKTPKRRSDRTDIAWLPLRKPCLKRYH